MLPPATTAPRVSTKMPSPFTIMPIIAPDFLGGGGVASPASSAIVSIPSAARLPPPELSKFYATPSGVLFTHRFQRVTWKPASPRAPWRALHARHACPRGRSDGYLTLRPVASGPI